jgi:vacuolar-type H+-ATPase subunit H
MNQGENNSYPQLTLQEFRWTRGSQLKLSFTPGLNIIHGKTPFDRTIVLRLIRFALGGNAERINESLLRASESVELAFSANGNSIRSMRNCQVPTGKMQVFAPDQRRELTPREMTEFMLDELALPKIYRTESREGKQVDVLLTFNDLSRAIFVDRDISYPGILNEMPRSPRIQTTEVMLGLKTVEIAKIENQMRQIENRRNQIHQEIAAIQNFLAHLDVPALIEIQTRRDRLVGVLTELISRQDQLRAKIQTDIESHSTELDDAYNELRSELLDKRQEAESDEQEIADLDRQTTEKSDLRSVLEAEARRMNRHLSSQHVVSTFTFSQCPRCLQPITSEMCFREDEGICMLCGRPFSEHRNVGIAAWEKSLRDANQAIHEVSQLLENYKRHRAELHQKRQVILQRIKWLEDQLVSSSQHYVSPLIEEIELMAGERTEIEKALSQLDYEQRQREYAMQIEDEFLPRAKRELEELDRSAEELRQDLGSRTDRYSAFLAHFKHFLRNIHLVHDLGSIEWDEDEQLPLIDGQSYKRTMVGPDLAIVVLAFHYALIAMSVAQPCVKTNHPKLLVIDEPEQQKMGKDRYQEVMRLIGSLALEHKDAVQIIVATETADIPSAFAEYGVEI